MTDKSNRCLIDAECNVCYLKNDPIKCKKCEHMMCNDCIKKWYETSIKCPMCRASNTYPNPNPKVILYKDPDQSHNPVQLTSNIHYLPFDQSPPGYYVGSLSYLLDRLQGNSVLRNDYNGTITYIGERNVNNNGTTTYLGERNVNNNGIMTYLGERNDNNAVRYI